MAKRRDYEKELQDVIDYIKKHPDKQPTTENSQNWYNYLTDVLNINPASVESDKGSAFWEKVRQEVQPQSANGFEYDNLPIEQKAPIEPKVDYRATEGKEYKAYWYEQYDSYSFG